MPRDITIRFLGDLTHLERSSVRASSTVEGSFGKMVGLAAGLTAALGVAGLGKSVLDMGIQFQDLGNTWSAVTQTAMTQMQQKAIELGNDLSLPSTSAADAEQAMVELAKGGLSAAESMAAAKGTLQLAAAAGVDAGQAATFAADALNTFHLKGKDATMVADLLAGAANASSGEITDMALSLQQAGAVFAAAHIPIQTTVTLISEMAQNGIRGSDAGTSLKTMMLALQTPTSQAAGLMKQLNIHLYDSKGAMRDFRDIIADAQGPLSKLNQAQRDQALGTIFGSDAVRSANVIFGQGVKAYDDMRTAVTKQGVAAEVAGAKSQGLGGAWRGLQSQAETFGLTIFEQVSPALETLVRGLADRLPAVMDGASKGLSGVVQWIGDAAKVVRPFATDVMHMFQQAFTDNSKTLGQFQGDLKDLGQQITNLVKSEGFASFLAALMVYVPASFGVLVTSIQVAIDNLKLLTTVMAGAARVSWDIAHQDFAAAWRDMTDTVQTEGSNMEQLQKDQAARDQAIAHAMSDQVTAEYEGMKTKVLGVTSGMHQEQQAQAVTQGTVMRNLARGVGTQYSDGMADGIGAAAPTAAAAARQATEEAVAAGRAATSDAYALGGAIAAGVASGINANSYQIKSAAAGALRDALTNARNENLVASPSRRWADLLGKPIMQGVAMGMWENSRLVDSAARMVAGLANMAGPASFGVNVGALAPAAAGAAIVRRGAASAAPVAGPRTYNITNHIQGSGLNEGQLMSVFDKRLADHLLAT